MLTALKRFFGMPLYQYTLLYGPKDRKTLTLTPIDGGRPKKFTNTNVKSSEVLRYEGLGPKGQQVFTLCKVNTKGEVANEKGRYVLPDEEWRFVRRLVPGRENGNA